MKKAAVWIIILIMALSIVACSTSPGGVNLPDVAVTTENAEAPGNAEVPGNAEALNNAEVPDNAEPFGSPESSSLQGFPLSEGAGPALEPEPERKPIVLAFGGDVNFADNWETMQELRKQGNILSNCISQPLLDRMIAADIFLLNNEFAFSDRGAPMKDKAYTFRAKPENVNYLLEMGVDIVSLGNNHVFDYGKDAFYDTLDTLTEADIKYVGAGGNLAEAMEAQYFAINDITFAYVAASRAEKYILTPAAEEDKPGILRTYDSALFLEAIRTARENADIVIALVHWGTEYSYVLEEAQTELARELIDSGVDLIVGAHSHCLQGIEYYNGKPIIYSLGNLWFNGKTLDTALLEVIVDSPDELTLKILPCLQESLKTTLLLDEPEQRKVFDLLESISPNQSISIDDDGVVTVKH